MSDKSKRTATKRYQNSDYPSGSFEAAISGEPSSGLHLVREPSLDGRSDDDLAEMVPAFMHRDFFRTEEDDSDPVPAPAAPRPPTLSTPAGYVEPPNTEDVEALEPEAAQTSRSGRPSLPTSVIAPETGARPSFAETGARPSSTGTGARPSSAKPASRVPASQLKVPPVENRPVEPVVPSEILGEAPSLAPLRSHEIPEPPEPPRQVSPPPRSAAPEPAPPAPNSPVTAYSLPLLAALAMILGVFVWRETTRPVVVSQPLPIPQTTTIADPSGEPTSAAPGFQPNYLSVGPAVPPQTDPSGSPTPSGGEAMVQEVPQQDNPASLFPGASNETAQEEDPDAEERSAMLEHMTSSSSASAQAAESAPVRVNSQGSSNPAALFPTDAAPEPPAAKPVAAQPPAAKPAAAKPPAAKPAEKPVNRPSAAELFPIDEEVPVRRPAVSSPVVAQPVSEPPLPPISTAPVAPAPPGEPYQIDEPNF